MFTNISKNRIISSKFGKLLIGAAIFGISGTPALAHDCDIAELPTPPVVPHTFAPNTSALSSEVNSNFAQLETNNFDVVMKINEIIQNCFSGNTDPTPPPIPPSNGLIAHYAFEDTVGDTTGNHTAGTTVGISYQAGVVGQAVYFNGSAYAKLNLGNDSGFHNADFTMSMWAKLDSVPSSAVQMFMNPQPPPPNTAYFGLFSYDSSESQIVVGDGQPHRNLVVPTEWKNYVVRRTGNTWDFYIDGTLAESFSHSGSISTGSEAAIGGFPAGNEIYNAQSGHIDEIRIYGRSLSDAEVQTLCQQGAAAAGITCGLTSP